VRSQLAAWETAVEARVTAEREMVLADIKQRVDRKRAEREVYRAALAARKAGGEAALFAPFGPSNTSVL
jgi:hypothetical protein